MKLYAQVLVVLLVGALLLVDQSEGSSVCLFGCLRSMLACKRGADREGYSKVTCCKRYDECFSGCSPNKVNTYKCIFPKRNSMVERRGSWNKRGDEDMREEDFGLMDGPYFL